MPGTERFDSSLVCFFVLFWFLGFMSQLFSSLSWGLIQFCNCLLGFWEILGGEGKFGIFTGAGVGFEYDVIRSYRVCFLPFFLFGFSATERAIIVLGWFGLDLICMFWSINALNLICIE